MPRFSKKFTCIESAIEEADFIRKTTNRRMYVMQVNGWEMVVSDSNKYHRGRVMYQTKAGR